jgi:nucleotide-binding universal stress UspA family protein
MERKNLLYIANATPPENEPAFSRSLQQLGFENTNYYIMGETTLWEKLLGQQGISVGFRAEKKPSLSRIMGKAQEEKASLITVNLSSKGSGLSRRSVIKGLMRFTQVPFLLLPETSPFATDETSSGDLSPKGGIFNHVIFATDWSPFSQKCLDALIHFKEDINELEIVTVIDKKLSIRDMIGLKDMLGETRNHLKDQGIDAEGHVYAGKPSEEILLAVKDYGGSVVVMDASHRSAVKTFFKGNCTYEVAEKADVPILVIP